MPAAQVNALRNRGSIDQWTRKDRTPPKLTTPLDGLGGRLGAGSWFRFPGHSTTRRVPLYASPAVWNEFGRFSSVAIWAGNANRTTPVQLPWEKSWKGPGGFTADLDNGIFVDTLSNRTEGWEILGMRPASDWDRLLIGLAAGGRTPAKGCYVADRINQRRPGVTLPTGAQGPGWWNAGVVGPEHFTGTALGAPARLEGYNVAWGVLAAAASGGRVEPPTKTDPFGANHPVLRPSGNQPGVMIPPWTQFSLSITDQQIENWLNAQNVPAGALRRSKTAWAKLLRTNGFRLAVTGTGNPHIVFFGTGNPTDKRGWDALGVTSDTIARNLGKGLFSYATLGVAS